MLHTPWNGIVRMGMIAWVVAAMLAAKAGAESRWQVGFAKADITPTEPIRLSGYANRTEPSSGVADPLSARAMVITNMASQGERVSNPASAPSNSSDVTSPDSPSPDSTSPGSATTLVLASIDSISVSSLMTDEIARWLSETYGIGRSQFVLSCTHSHATPHLSGSLSNLFQQALTEDETAAIDGNTELIVERVKQTIAEAMQNRQLAALEIGTGRADFAAQRRLLTDGAWSGFGERPGPVDQRVRVLSARAPRGELLGAAFLYACHCTTLSGGTFNQVSGDWAGVAASRLEQIHPSTVFLSVIGCGADANPSPRGTYDMMLTHAASMVDAVETVLKSDDRTTVTSPPTARFGYAGLAPEQPTQAIIEQRLQSDSPNERRWAESMQQIREEMGRLPETYPMPIHTWQFGNDLTWVFLGGEVVVDYQLQIEKELASENVWVAAYTDDVFAYVASEAMRAEGGYEVDGSMIYYLQPGRWQSGTQALIVRRVKEILNNELTESDPLSAEEALGRIRVPEGFRVELAASEPLVVDPINMAFGPDGRVWVVEMADYPQGIPGGGRVKWLRDNDGDGVLDQAQVFASELSYPTSVFPWRGGALIIAAPDVIYAEDTDGDGSADRREVLLSGIAESNPQHRASGFEIGLDGFLHLSSGEGTRELLSSRNGKTYPVSHHDVAWNPDTGEVRATSGETQFVRARDAFGNWFGNSNSLPMYQYVIDSHYLTEQLIDDGGTQHLLYPPVAPPVYPRAKLVDRFNDLYARSRFTSACSSIVARFPPMGASLPGAAATGFVCEPVHHLVARIAIYPQGSHFTATRHPDDEEFDFFTSTDPWSRPVRAINGPEGSLWIVDMTRKVIEHPQWIPTAWQDQLDLRAGANLGRIYRVLATDQKVQPFQGIGSTAADVLAALASENGAVRDLALMRLIDDAELDLERDVRRLSVEHENAEVRASALGCLLARGWLTQDAVTRGFEDPHASLVRLAIEFSERVEISNPESFEAAFARIPERNLGPQVDLQWILTSTVLPQPSESPASGRLKALEQIASRSAGDTPISQALSLVRDGRQALAIAHGMLSRWQSGDAVSANEFLVARMALDNLWQRLPETARGELATQRFEVIAGNSNGTFSPADLLLLSVVAASDSSAVLPNKLKDSVVLRARQRLLDPAAAIEERAALANLLGSGFLSADDELTIAAELLDGTGATLKPVVLEALRRVPSAQVAALIVSKWDSFNVQLRSTASATLMSRAAWVGQLIEALENGRIPVKQLDASTVQLLRSHHDLNLRTRAVALFGSPTPRTEVIAAYQAAMPAPSPKGAGAQLFNEHCATCHQAPAGTQVIGPSLDNLKHWTIEQWLSGILDPNKNVEPKYQQSLVLTSDGETLVGITQERSSDRIRLALADGSRREIPRDNIEGIQESQSSLMPEGFESKLTPEQVAELIGFLRSR